MASTSSTTKCLVCNIKSECEKVKELNQESLKKLRYILTARRKFNLKYKDVTLPDNISAKKMGYHLSCYRKFTAVQKKYLDDAPPPSPTNINVDKSDEKLNVEVESNVKKRANTVKDYGLLFCHTCLSRGRALFPIGEYTDIYHYIAKNVVVMDLPLKLVCWECTAVMRKIKLFQEQVERSQRLLLSHFADKQAPLPSLSSLTTTVVNPEHAFNIVFEETDRKTEIDILPKNFTTETHVETEIKDEQQNVQVKEEITDDFDNNMDSSFEWIGDNVIKSEEEDNIDKAEQDNKSQCTKFCEKNKVNKHNEYKITSKVTKKMFKEMCNVHYVGFGDVKDLLYSQKNNDLYKCRYKCKSCVLSWPKVEDFNRHDEKFHKFTNSLVCEYCTCRFKSKSRLRSHIDRHRELFECRACGHRAAGRMRMERHLADAHRVRCNACEATFHSVVQFYRHYKKYHELFICDYCSRKCRMKSALEKHITNQHMDNIQCETCKVQFKSMRTLRTHVARKHVTTGGEDAYCVECDKQFLNALVYREHIRSWITHQKVDRKKCICSCPECGKTYHRLSSMQNHYNFVHKKQSKYVCHECDKQFLNRTKYANHMRFVHEGKKKLKNKLCTICGRGFSENRILINHMRTHTGERPHACALCPARFAQSTALHSHVAHVHQRLPRGGNKC